MNRIILHIWGAAAGSRCERQLRHLALRCLEQHALALVEAVGDTEVLEIFRRGNGCDAEGKKLRKPAAADAVVGGASSAARMCMLVLTYGFAVVKLGRD